MEVEVNGNNIQEPVNSINSHHANADVYQPIRSPEQISDIGYAGDSPTPRHRYGITDYYLDDEDADNNDKQLPEPQDMKQMQKGRVKRMVTATLLTTLVIIGYSIYSDSYGQWLYRSFQKQVLGSNFSMLNTSEINNPCLKENKTTIFKKQLDEAQKQTSDFISTSYIVSLVPALFFNLMVGPYIDYVGRKAFFIIPTLGFFLRLVLTWAISFWNLNLKLLYFGYLIEGITGSLGALFMALYVYTADNTNEKESRSFVMVAVQTVVSFGLSSTHVAVGYLIANEGYTWPFAIAGIITFISILGYIVFLEETLLKSRRSACFNVFEGAKKVFSFYLIKNPNPMYQRKDYILLATIFFLFGTCIAASIQTLYTMAEPFCWTPTKIGYVATFQGMLLTIGPLMFMRIMQKYAGDDIICVIALIMSAAGKIVFSFAKYDWMLYLGLSLAVLELSVLSIIRAILSRTVALEYRGALFSSIAVVEVSTFAVSGAGLNSLYSATISVWIGLTYFVIGVCLFFAGILMIFYAVIIRRRISRLQYVPVPCDGNPEKNLADNIY